MNNEIDEDVPYLFYKDGDVYLTNLSWCVDQKYWEKYDRKDEYYPDDYSNLTVDDIFIVSQEWTYKPNRVKMLWIKAPIIAKLLATKLDCNYTRAYRWYDDYLNEVIDKHEQTDNL